jgi:DNA gyrase subunit B
VHLLRRLDELVQIAERRGVKFVDLLASRSGDPEVKGGRRTAGRLPSHRVTWRGGEEFHWSESSAHAALEKRGLRLADDSHESGGAPSGSIRELHENRELERLFADLAAIGLDINDYALVQEESVTGERMPARYAWMLSKVEHEEHAHAEPQASVDGASDEPEERVTTVAVKSNIVECPSIATILAGLKEIGRRGLEIKRFKGLGEMDAEQLWDTTMDASRRVLMRVTWDMASDADAIFSILMGEEVEPRRRFIEEHALDVKNLDV